MINTLTEIRPLPKTYKPTEVHERSLLSRAAEQCQYLAERTKSISKSMPDTDVITAAIWKGRSNAYDEMAGYLRALDNGLSRGNTIEVLALLDAQDQIPEIIERQFWIQVESAKAVRENVEKEVRDRIYQELHEEFVTNGASEEG